jgi:hypothetical protein
MHSNEVNKTAKIAWQRIKHIVTCTLVCVKAVRKCNQQTLKNRSFVFNKCLSCYLYHISDSLFIEISSNFKNRLYLSREKHSTNFFVYLNVRRSSVIFQFVLHRQNYKYRNLVHRLGGEF